MQQIPLDIELKVDATFDNFIEGDNQLLVEVLKNCLDKPEFVYFYGEQSAGKTHLLQALAHHAISLEHYNIAYIPLDADFLTSEMLTGLETFDGVCLDNLDAILTMPDTDLWQLELFNLYNQLKEKNKSFIISATRAPAQMNLSLADLKSRLSAMLIHAIKPLSDEAKLSFLGSKAAAKGLELNEDAARFLLTRGQRDLASLNGILEQLDEASLQAQRKLTIPFIKEVLKL